MELLLLISVFVIATCGLVYELIAGTLASYLLGDSITQFSTIIGCYLFAMGIGSWLSRYVTRNLLGFFIRVEILVGAVGGSSAAILFLAFEHVASFRLLLYFLVGVDRHARRASRSPSCCASSRTASPSRISSPRSSPSTMSAPSSPPSCFPSSSCPISA